MTIAKKMIKKLNEVYTSATYLFLLRNGIAVGSKSQSIIRLMVRWRLVNETEANYTYGYLTKSKRIELGLPKSHVNDAFVIANGTNQNRTIGYKIKLVRKCNRKLFKGKRSEIKNKCPRIIFGFRLFDKVKYLGEICFIFGRRTCGYFDLRTIDSKSVSKSANYKKLNLIETSKTMLISFYPVD